MRIAGHEGMLAVSAVALRVEDAKRAIARQRGVVEREVAAKGGSGDTDGGFDLGSPADDHGHGSHAHGQQLRGEANDPLHGGLGAIVGHSADARARAAYGIIT
jgi:hypothetical protein